MTPDEFMDELLESIAEMEQERAEHPERFETVTDEEGNTVTVWRRGRPPRPT